MKPIADRHHTKPIRMAVIALLALFAVSTVTTAAGATVMSLATAMADMDMADCVGCDDDGSGPDGLACDIVCFTPMVGILDGGIASDYVAPSPVPKPVATFTHPGRTGPPDPFPPRALP